MVGVRAESGDWLSRTRNALRIGRALRLVWESSPRLTVLNLGISFLQALVPLAALYLLKLIVDEVTSVVGGNPEVTFTRVSLLIGIAALVALIGEALRISGVLANEAQGACVSDHVYSVLHEKALELDLECYEEPSYQDLVLRTQQEATSRPPQVLRSLLGVLRSCITLAAIIALLAAVHWLLILILAATSLPSLWVQLRFARKTHRWMKERAPLERMVSYLTMILATPWFAKDLRMGELGVVLAPRFRQARKRLRTERLRLHHARGKADLMTHGFAALAVFGALAFIAHETVGGALTVGGMVMYLQAVQKGQAVFGELTAGIGGLYEHNLFLSHLDEFLALEPKITAPPDPAPVRLPLRRGIEVRDVSFCYPSASRLSLRDASLEVHPGEMVAVVGANGSGKSTLMKLICRLYEPTSGSIHFDGRDLRSYDPKELRRNISILFQDFNTYGFSAADNIWFGDVHRPRDERRVKDAARIATVDRVFERFPSGLETVVGRLFEGAQNISGGERQKLALARAFYSDAPVLILDEPSSALDAKAEIDLFRHIRAWAADRAVIVISHRFSTVRMADRIYVLDEGEVVEHGSHDALMRSGGRYAKLFRLQALQYWGDDRQLTGPLHDADIERALGARAGEVDATLLRAVPGTGDEDRAPPRPLETADARPRA